jgi:hypothetical protein
MAQNCQKGVGWLTMGQSLLLWGNSGSQTILFVLA